MDIDVLDINKGIDIQNGFIDYEIAKMKPKNNCVDVYYNSNIFKKVEEKK